MSSPSPLRAEKLYTSCGVDFSYDANADFDVEDRMLGQMRAVEAIELGTEMELPGFNLFVLGPPGTGKHSFIHQYLKEKAEHRSPPSDWCYVNNFDEPRNPKAIELPPGMGRRFREDMQQLIEEARSTIPTAFEGEDYHKRRQAIEKIAGEEQEKAFAEVQKHAEAAGLRINQTSTGFNFVPLRKGEPISPEEFKNLSEHEQARLEEETEELSQELRRMLQAIPQRVRKVLEQISRLDREVALFALGGLIEELVEKYTRFPKVVDFLKSVQQDIADHTELFTQASAGPSPAYDLIAPDHTVDLESSVKRRYAVNVVVDRDDMKGAPVVFEDHPTYPYLIGQIEHVAKMGTLSTDFTLIRGGALHRANGGYLVIDALKILTQPFAWDALKRVLKSQEIDIKSPLQAYSLVSTVSLEPEPIPLNTKVIIIGDRRLYYLLQQFDPEFSELFKIAADFEEDMERSTKNVDKLARLISTIAKRESLKPIDKNGMARAIEESSRHAGDAEMLSTQIRRIADIIREAHYWAGRSDSNVITAESVHRAIESQYHRASRIHDRLLRETLRDTLFIDTQGATVGQINGLAVMLLGDHMFGHPSRITARLSLGSGKVIDIEREVELGGPIHSKGVLILSNFLASHYVTDKPLSLSASLVFEQSYGPVDGDSASAAELCVLLSALSRIPIKQSLAITGSVNQHGRIQPIGGVNQKIEAFFDLCDARGLSGDQGVVIPASNVKHLMLRPRVVDAVAQEKFHVYAVDNIDECMEILTGREAGNRDERGNFPHGSLNQRITARLIEFAEIRRDFGSARDKESNQS